MNKPSWSVILLGAQLVAYHARQATSCDCSLHDVLAPRPLAYPDQPETLPEVQLKP